MRSGMQAALPQGLEQAGREDRPNSQKHKYKTKGQIVGWAVLEQRWVGGRRKGPLCSQGQDSQEGPWRTWATERRSQ